MVSEKRGRDEGKVYLCNFSLYHMRKDRQSASMKERKRKKEENQRNGIREKEGRKEKKDQGMMSQGKKNLDIYLLSLTLLLHGRNATA